MGKIVLSVIVSILILGLSQQATAVPIQLSPTVDGDSDGASLFTNFPALQLGNGAGNTWRSFIEFDISGIGEVSSATLQFNVDTTNPSASIDIFSYPVSGPPNISFYNAGTLIFSALSADTVGLHTIDVTTEIVTLQLSATNSVGFRLKHTTESPNTLMTLSSSESAQGPLLIIDFVADTIVGGTSLPLDTTASLVAGFNANSIWMIPTVLGLAGAGFIIFKLKRK